MGRLCVLGKYIYLEASSRKRGATAQFTSPFIEVANETSCINLFYSMIGKDIGELVIYKLQTDYSAVPLWSREGKVAGQWNRVLLKLKPGLYRIMIQGSVGSGAYGDIAIDDISINHCESFSEYIMQGFNLNVQYVFSLDKDS